MAVDVGTVAHSERLEAIHDLLPVLVSARDALEICEHLGGISPRLVRRDVMRLALLADDGVQLRIYEAHGNGRPVVVSGSPMCPPRDLTDAHMADEIRSDGTAWAGISAPIGVNERAVGFLALHVRHPTRYTIDDLALLRWLADYVAIAVSHQRLAASVKQAAAERERMTTVEASMELLRTISD